MQQYVCVHCIRAKVQYVRCPIVEEKMHELGILMLRLFRMPANIGAARLQLDLATGDPAAMMSQKHKPRTAENNPVLHIFLFRNRVSAQRWTDHRNRKSWQP